MSTRDTILYAIRQHKPAEESLPVIDATAAITYPDLYAQFKSVLETIGGVCVEAADETAAREYIRSLDPVPVLVDTTTSFPDNLATQTASALADVDLAIIKGGIAVAENGAIWVTEKEMVNRLLPFIAQQLILIIHEKDIVPTMHQAYEKIRVNDTGFGAFIAGPSKTADIEQSLVIGAHGPCGMRAVVVRGKG